ncbi:MAG TPA: hypothetical protein PK913_07885, partial [Phenylobacterium sp.]|nr:hypothetical protein [Phenylobacterium sp.]
MSRASAEFCTIRSRSAWRGGSSSSRDLGVEVDGSVLLQRTLAEHLVLSGGVEGGVFVPGGAFTDASGQSMSPAGLLRLR